MTAAHDQYSIPAVYMRGGTSRALIFHRRDLPADQTAWAALFAAALGSPDPGERQLDGMGGGISSLSKVAVVGPSTHAAADVDFTFVQVEVSGSGASYKGNCGNISAAIGPFAVDEGLVDVAGDHATVRIHNTNTGKIIRSEFGVTGGKASVAGPLAIAGVAGTGAPIRLAFEDPGGAATGHLLPTGRPIDRLMVSGRQIPVSLVDSANPVVFVAADTLGLTGTEAPAALAAAAALIDLFEQLRIAGGDAMGLPTIGRPDRPAIANLPLVGILSRPDADDPPADLRIRMISAGQPHKAVPLTGALCTAIAARTPGTIVAELAGDRMANEPFTLAHPSGTLLVDAVFADDRAIEAVVLRTARRLFEGRVLIPTGALNSTPGPRP